MYCIVHTVNLKGDVRMRNAAPQIALLHTLICINSLALASTNGT